VVLKKFQEEKMRAEQLLQKYPRDVLGALRDLNGYYVCPKDSSGKRLGPLVGYAGKDEWGRHYVGEIYANFAKMEEYPFLLDRYASALLNVFHNPDDRLVFCGAPLGGMGFATILASVFRVRYVFPDKIVTSLATEHQREQSELVFKRHSLHPGDRVVIVEDVANNFSTTDKMISLAEDQKARVERITSLLNRSLKIDKAYKGIPVDCLVRLPIDEWEQDDLGVAEDVKKGNVIWKPKDQWDVLEYAMKHYAV